MQDVTRGYTIIRWKGGEAVTKMLVSHCKARVMDPWRGRRSCVKRSIKTRGKQVITQHFVGTQANIHKTDNRQDSCGRLGRGRNAKIVRNSKILVTY